jgi:hypothetical protein
MAFTSFDSLQLALPGQRLFFQKTGSVATTALLHTSMWGAAGNPVAGTLAIGNTTNGVIPTSATTGAVPFVNAPAGKKTYLARLNAFNVSQIFSSFLFYDRLWHAGSFSLVTLQTFTLSAQPALTRPDANGEDVEIWLEINTAPGAVATTVEVTYTNSTGATGHTTGASIPLTSFLTGRAVQMPLQAGDTGVRKVESVIIGGTANTQGDVNVVLLRKITEVSPLPAQMFPTLLDALSLGLPEVQPNACIAVIVMPNSTVTGSPTFTASIVAG